MLNKVKVHIYFAWNKLEENTSTIGYLKYVSNILFLCLLLVWGGKVGECLKYLLCLWSSSLWIIKAPPLVGPHFHCKRKHSSSPPKSFTTINQFCLNFLLSTRCLWHQETLAGSLGTFLLSISLLHTFSVKRTDKRYWRKTVSSCQNRHSQTCRLKFPTNVFSLLFGALCVVLLKTSSGIVYPQPPLVQFGSSICLCPERLLQCTVGATWGKSF